jgi:phenylacetic acid degradation operon negative regulatory protein
MYIDAVLRQAKPRLSTLLKLMFSEAQAFGHQPLWLGSVIALLEPFGFQERTVRTALFRLAESKMIRIERHGRRSLCLLTPATATAILAARQRLNRPAARSFNEDWTMLLHTGGVSAARYASARKQLLQLDYCALAPNLMARPASYSRGLPADDDHGLARFDVPGRQLAAATRQPLFGKMDWDLQTPRVLYTQFLQRFSPLRTMLGKRSVLTDQQACMVRLLVSHGYQQCRRSDPLLPRELLPEDWPATAAHQTYVALYAGCATPALEATTPAAPRARSTTRQPHVCMTA